MRSSTKACARWLAGRGHGRPPCPVRLPAGPDGSGLPGLAGVGRRRLHASDVGQRHETLVPLIVDPSARDLLAGGEPHAVVADDVLDEPLVLEHVVCLADDLGVDAGREDRVGDPLVSVVKDVAPAPEDDLGVAVSRSSGSPSPGYDGGTRAGDYSASSARPGSTGSRGGPRPGSGAAAATART